MYNGEAEYNADLMYFCGGMPYNNVITPVTYGS